MAKREGPSGKEWEAYRTKELEHWAEHGKGSGTYFEWNGERWRLDRKAERGKPVRYSAKSINRKKKESLKGGSERAIDLKNTTNDPLANKAFGRWNPNKGPLHHAVPRKLMANMLLQFEKNLNPNWTPEMGTTPEGKNFIRVLEKRLGISVGDSLVNQRSYPPDDLKSPAISEVHVEAHKLGDKYGINSKTSFKGYTNNQLFDYAKNKLGPAVKKIDAELGFEPEFKTAGQAGKHLRIKQILASQKKANKYSGLSDVLANPPENYQVTNYATKNGNGNGVNGNGNGVNGKNGNGVAVNGKNGKNGFLKGMENVNNYSGLGKLRDADQLANIGVNVSTGNYVGAGIGAATYGTSKALQNKQVQARVAKQITKLVAERGAKSAAKMIPGLDVLLSGKESWDYLKRGRWDQAGVAALSGAIGWIPLIGDGASAALDLSNTGLDIARLQAPTGANKKKGQNRLSRYLRGLNN